MRRVLCGLLLVLVAAVSAQQQQPPNDRHGTPPTFPEGQPPKQAMPPDTSATSAAMSSWQVQQQIQNKLNSEPSLANTNVKASANDSAVVLTGIVDSERQHQLVLGIAQSYAGDREILDRIQVQGQT